MKTRSLIILFFIVWLLFPPVALANVWINEFSSNGSADWIELYNDGSESINLELYRIRDGSATNKLDLSGQIAPKSFVVFEWSTKLNNSGDTIRLVSAADENSVIDQVSYGNSGDITAPAAGQTGGRQTDGGTLWILFGSATKNTTNISGSPLPTPTSIPQNTPTPIKQPTPTRTPTPTKSPTKTITPKASSISAENVDATVVSTKKTTTTKLLTSVTPHPKISVLPTAILGMSTSSALAKAIPGISVSPNSNVMVEGATADPIPIIVGAGFLVACGILVFIKKWLRRT